MIFEQAFLYTGLDNILKLVTSGTLLHNEFQKRYLFYYLKNGIKLVSFINKAIQ